MKTFYIFLWLHIWIFSLCSGQRMETNCNFTNCNSTDVEICTTNGQLCKRFSNECSLRRENCNATLSTVWNRTDSLQCLNLRSNESGVCACPALRTCSNRPTPVEGICVHRNGLNCHLFRTECDLTRARCNGEVWHNIDVMQCRGFNLGQTGNCTCPNTIECARNRTELCVRVGATNNCRFYDNQCDLEAAKCRGEILRTISIQQCMGFENAETRNCSCPNLMTCSRNATDICIRTATGCRHLRNECELEQLKCQDPNITILPAIQCRLLRAGGEGSCACPNWLNCQQNVTQICAETEEGCRLLTNQCDLEELKCQDDSVNVTNILQCQGFRDGQQRNCACPELKTCSRLNTTRVCAKNYQGCKLMANSCDFEMAKCRGERWCSVDSVQCQNFPIGQQRNCSCPNMDTCAQNNRTNICVNLQGACRLMRNQCDLERAKCNGQAWSSTSAIQCRNFRPNEWRWCACPRLLNCCSKVKPFCVKSPQGCRIMKTECEFQMARCRGEAWLKADDLECKGFTLGQPVRTCTCPRLATCRQRNPPTTPTSVCVRNTNGCKLLRSDCELERSLCSGEDWQRVDDLQCQNFSFHETRSCHCPGLFRCSNTTRVCGRTPTNQCYHFRSECDMKLSQCEGQEISLTNPQRCQGFRLGTSDVCRCRELRGCNRRLRVCGRRGRQCKLFRNDCDFRNSTCLEENWQRTSLANCCQFNSNEIGDCTISLATAVCGMNSRQCRLFSSRCEMNRVNLTAPRRWRLVSRSNCQCLRVGRASSCKRRPTCRPRNTTVVCARHGRTIRSFNSTCHLSHHNFRRCTNFRAVSTSLCRDETT